MVSDYTRRVANPSRSSGADQIEIDPREKLTTLFEHEPKRPGLVKVTGRKMVRAAWAR